MKWKLEELPAELRELLLQTPGMPTPQLYPAWHHWAINSPNPAWLVERIVPAQAFSLISGRPKDAKKTWLAVDIAACVATGMDIGDLRPTNKAGAPVLYAYMEDQAKDVAERNAMLARGMGFEIEALDRLHWFHLEPFFLNKSHDATWLAAYVLKHKIELIIFDTFAQVYAGSENDVDQVMVAVRHTRELNRLGAAVLWLHHLTKGAHAVDAGVPKPGRDIRGSSAMEGALSHHLALRQYPQADDPEQLYLFAQGKKYRDCYTVDWSMEDKKFARVSITPCMEPRFEEEKDAKRK